MHESQRTAELQAMIEMHVCQACQLLLQQLHDGPEQNLATLFHHPEKKFLMRMTLKTKLKEVVVRLSIENLGDEALPEYKVEGRRTLFHENEVAYREFYFPIEGYHTRITSMSAARDLMLRSTFHGL